jgi:membrane protease YdiL (CAAX protease family)
MWAPGLGALLATRFGARESLSSLNLRRLGPKRFYLWAWLLPICLAIATAGLTWAFGAGDLDREFSLIQQSLLEGTPGGESFSPAVFAAGQILFAFTLAPLFNTLFALGEELGWRGFLLPRLLPLGQWKAILVSGAIWGVWHAPAILQGHNYPDHPILGVFMMIVFTVLLGAIFSWLYLETNSPAGRHLQLALSRDKQPLGARFSTRFAQRHSRSASAFPEGCGYHPWGYNCQLDRLDTLGAVRDLAGVDAQAPSIERCRIRK